jgi:hypothetical protein
MNTYDFSKLNIKRGVINETRFSLILQINNKDNLTSILECISKETKSFAMIFRMHIQDYDLNGEEQPCKVFYNCTIVKYQFNEIIIEHDGKPSITRDKHIKNIIRKNKIKTLLNQIKNKK